MGLFERKRQDDERPGEGSQLHLDLDEKVCTSCRRVLAPWQATCPADGGAAVRPQDLPPLHVPPPHLLDEDDEPGEDEPGDGGSERSSRLRDEDDAGEGGDEPDAL